MGDLKGAPAVHFNLPLLSFYLYTTFKTGIAIHQTSPIPSEWGMFGEWHEDLAGQLVDTRLADRWRCRNQIYLDNCDLTSTKNHG